MDFVRLESWRWWVRTPKQVLKYFLTLPLQFISLIRWVFYLNTIKPDIVHFNINRLVEPVFAARILRIPSMMHFRDIPSRIDSSFILGMSGFYKIMKLASAWIANSEATYNDVKDKGKNNIFEIPNGIDLEQFDRMIGNRKNVNSGENSIITIAMVALLVPWKNHKGLLKLVSIITKRFKKIQFILAGDGNQDYRQRLIEMTRELGIGNYVKFIGYQDNIPALLNSIDILVHTTEKEPFGRVFIEAMAARKPVIAFDSGGASEIVVNGETGILVSNCEIDAMESAILSLINDPDKRKYMGEAGRKRVEENYPIEKHCEDVADVYQDLLNSSNEFS